MSLNNIYVRSLAPRELFEGGAAAKVWDALTFDRRNRTTRAGEAAWRFASPDTVSGLALWWSADLAPGVTLSTSPAAPSTHWEQLYLPALEPIKVRRGDQLSIALRSTTSFERGTNVSWAFRLSDGAGRERVRQSLDLKKGYLP